MSAAPVAVTYPCGCCPDMGRYCGVGGLLKRADEGFADEADKNVNKGSDERAAELLGYCETVNNLFRKHLTGRW